MLCLTTLFSRAAHGAAAEEIDRLGLNASSDGYRSTGIASGLPYLEKLVPETKKELAESIARSLDGLDLEVGGACHQPTVLAVAGW